MKICFALLRAVNVGGTGILAMKDLKDLCIKAGFCDVQTYIASGNVMFRTDLAEADIKAVLGRVLRCIAAGRWGCSSGISKRCNPYWTPTPFRMLQPTGML